MATAPDIARAPADRKFTFASLARTAAWGIGAAIALFVAVLAGLSDTGSRRIAAVVSPGGETLVAKSATLEVPPPKPVAVTLIRPPPETKLETNPQPVPQAQIQPERNAETQRLQEQVRLLVADQDRLTQRIGTLERSLDDVTGSIRRQELEAKREAEAAPRAAASTGPVSTVSWPAIITAISTSAPAPDLPPDDTLADMTASIPRGTPVPPSRPATSEDETDESIGRTSAVPAVAPLPPPVQPDTKEASTNPAAPSTPAKRIVHGIDLGGATSVERLRAMWRGLQSNEATLLQGLRPLALMSGTRRGRPDVRLIAGPVASAKEANKLCSALLNAGRYCEPATFAGHRLTSR
jgi:hypothetical protein